MLLRGSLLSQGDLQWQEDKESAGSLVGTYLACHTYQEHARVQPVGGGLADQIIGGMELLHGPLVLLGQLLQTLGLGQGPL